MRSWVQPSLSSRNCSRVNRRGGRFATSSMSSAGSWARCHERDPFELSGAHATPSTAPFSAVSCRDSPGPSTGSRNSCAGASSRADVNASQRPSGDHRGELSRFPPKVNRLGAADPSACTLQMALRGSCCSSSTHESRRRRWRRRARAGIPRPRQPIDVVGLHPTHGTSPLTGLGRWSHGWTVGVSPTVSRTR